MTRDVALGKCYSKEGLIKAVSAGYLYDYIAQWYYQMGEYDLKEVLLAVLATGLDNCYSDEDEKNYNQQILDELECRFFGVEEEEE